MSRISAGPKEKSIVFICPDYHCSFLYRDELRKLGWKADIYVPPQYPNELLYGIADMKVKEFDPKNPLSILRCQIEIAVHFFRCLVRYKNHLYFGRFDHFCLIGETVIPILRYVNHGHRLHLILSRLFRRKIILVPSGTPDEVSVDDLQLLGNRDEGVDTEDRRLNRNHLKMVRRYSNLNIGLGFLHTNEFPQTHLQYRSLDLQRWQPEIEIPTTFKLERKDPNTLWVLHSFMYSKERQELQGGNIKGTRYVIEAVKRLKSEGLNIELLMFDKVPTRDYIYIQAQADIVVEELIRGCWGSTAVECMALGKPVLTYVRKEWENAYLKTFPWISELPVLNTDKYSIYDNLKKVATSKTLRDSMSVRSREFAVENFDVRKNVHGLVDAITRI